MLLIRFKNIVGSKLNSFSDKLFDDLSTIDNPNNKLISVANVIDEKEVFLISLEVSGIKKEEFNIELKQGQLIISGEKIKSSEDQEDNYTRQEYSYSSFNRSLNLPKNIKVDKIETKYEDEKSKIRIPKSNIEVSDHKRIKIA